MTEELIRLKQQKEIVTLPFEQFSKETKTLFPQIEELSYGKIIATNFKQKDTLPALMIKWSRKTSRSTRKKMQTKLYLWVKERFNLDTLKIVTIP